MNCPKCNAPLNEGDKFCQTCGSVIQPAVQPQEQPVAPTVVENNMQQPMANMAPPVNNVQQIAPVGNIPSEPKKNNTIVYVLLGVIAVLLAGVIFLAVSSGSDDKEKEDKKDDKPEVK